MKRWLSLALFIILVVAGGTAIGTLTVPGEWYAGLAKPAFNPPAWVFAPVWTILYVAIGIAGWRAWRLDPDGPLAVVWWVQLALNFLWSPVFFAARNPDLALAIIVVLLATIVVFIVLAARRDRIAAWLFAPYALWVAFATVLNAAIVWLN